MQFIKLLALTLSFLCTIITSSTAQSDTSILTDQQRTELKASLEEYESALSLTMAQKLEFDAVTTKYVLQMIPLKESGDSQWSKIRKLKTMQANKNEEMSAILSKDQYKLYLNKQKAKRKTMMDRNK